MTSRVRAVLQRFRNYEVLVAVINFIAVCDGGTAGVSDGSEISTTVGSVVKVRSHAIRGGNRLHVSLVNAGLVVGKFYRSTVRCYHTCELARFVAEACNAASRVGNAF